MDSTRLPTAAPFPVFQDHTATNPAFQSGNPIALQTTYHAASNTNTDSPRPTGYRQTHGISPMKPYPHSTHVPPNSPSSGRAYVPTISVPDAIAFPTDSPPKPPTRLPQPEYFFHPPRGAPVEFSFAPWNQPLFTTFSSVPENGYDVLSTPNTSSENCPPTKAAAQAQPRPHPSASYTGAPITGKRTSAEAPEAERPPVTKKAKVDETEVIVVPEPHEMPPVEDDGDKPSHSYAQMISMAILRAPDRRLTLAQIYKWIQDHFAFYRKGDSNWQNSIRHNLSLNKAFVKVSRPKNDPGKGNYWTIQAGMEVNFLKDRKRQMPPMATMAVGTATPASSEPPKPVALPGAIVQADPNVRDEQQQATPALAAAAAAAAVPPPTPTPMTRPGRNHDLSSDATWLASDIPLDDDSGEETEPELQGRPGRSGPRSSPPQVVKSSPPLAHMAPPAVPVRPVTPPTPSRTTLCASAVPRAPKRPATAMNDSGYFSSVESSALKKRRVSTSETEVEPPCARDGRAEAEIRRLRSSSHDATPMRRRVRRQSPLVMPASPLRDPIAPTTPAVRFLPVEAPPSLSPGTQLRNHRQLIDKLTGSPARRVGMESIMPHSPQFHLPEDYKVVSETETTEEHIESLDMWMERMGTVHPDIANALTYLEELDAPTHPDPNPRVAFDFPADPSNYGLEGPDVHPNEFDFLFDVIGGETTGDNSNSSATSSSFGASAPTDDPHARFYKSPSIFNTPKNGIVSHLLRRSDDVFRHNQETRGESLGKDDEDYDTSSGDDLENVDLANGFNKKIGQGNASTSTSARRVNMTFYPPTKRS